MDEKIIVIENDRQLWQINGRGPWRRIRSAVSALHDMCNTGSETPFTLIRDDEAIPCFVISLGWATAEAIAHRDALMSGSGIAQ